MTRVTRVTVDRSCAICERTLLMGERSIRFSPNGGADYVDVCPLCKGSGIDSRSRAPLLLCPSCGGSGHPFGYVPPTREEVIAWLRAQ